MDGDLNEALNYWFLGLNIDGLKLIDGGLSGATLWSFNAAETKWGLKQLAAGYSVDRMAEIDRVLAVARKNSALNLPQPRATANRQSRLGGSGWAVFGDRIWNCWHWCEGKPLDQAQLTESAVLDLVAWIAEFHTTVYPLAQTVSPAPTIHDRYRRLIQQREIFSTTFGNRTGSASPNLAGVSNPVHSDALQRAASILEIAWGRKSNTLIKQAEHWGLQSFSLQYVLRDVHPGNAIVNQGRLRTIIDLDAIRIDTPAADLARLLGDPGVIRSGSLQNHSALTLLQERAVVAYRAVRPLTDQDEALFRWLLIINPLVNLANWYIWLAVDRQDFGSAKSAAFGRLGNWTDVVAAELI